jgi:hypothetical protein
MAIRWLKQTDDGWIVTLDAAGLRRSLPSHMRLDWVGMAAGRDRFQVLEGIHLGTAGSLVSNSGLFSSNDPQLSAATVRFRDRVGGPATIDGVTYQKEILIEYASSAGTQSEGPFNAVGDQNNPIPIGTHVLQIPDFPHELGAPYSPFGTVWFRIGNTGDRYLHPGRISLGCATAQGSAWTRIYNAIIKRRGTSGNIGTLVAT